MSDHLPIPFQIEKDRSDTFNLKHHPSIVYSHHPVIDKPINELDYKNHNLIFNDIMQEAFITNNEKLKYLTRKFIGVSNTYEILIQNILKVYTHENGFYSCLNSVLREDRIKSFLGSSILLLNDAIRSNFSDLRYESKCYRKADLKQEEFDLYYNIYTSDNKIFCWKTFVSGLKNFDKINEIYNNINNSIYDLIDYNTIFTIEFSSDSWGLDISNFSLSTNDDEILLPAMSIFEMVKIEKVDNIVHIGLVKLDKNFKKKAKRLDSNWLITGLKIVDQEVSLLDNNEKDYCSRYCFVKDDDNPFKLKFALNGPPYSNYEGGTFQLNVFITEGYPNTLPIIKFVTKIWHPNISYDSGDLDTDTLKRIWKPTLSLSKLLDFIFNLLIFPDDKYEIMNTQVKKDYVGDRVKFDFNAKELTEKYAKFFRKINETQILNKFTELQARKELLKINSFQT